MKFIQIFIHRRLFGMTILTDTACPGVVLWVWENRAVGGCTAWAEQEAVQSGRVSVLVFCDVVGILNILNNNASGPDAGELSQPGKFRSFSGSLWTLSLND